MHVEKEAEHFRVDNGARELISWTMVFIRAATVAHLLAYPRLKEQRAADDREARGDAALVRVRQLGAKQVTRVLVHDLLAVVEQARDIHAELADRVAANRSAVADQDLASSVAQHTASQSISFSPS
jgi:hypothetical protein